jgi:hypothetical protein
MWRRENELISQRGASLDSKTMILNTYDLRILLKNCAKKRRKKLPNLKGHNTASLSLPTDTSRPKFYRCLIKFRSLFLDSLVRKCLTWSLFLWLMNLISLLTTNQLPRTSSPLRKMFSWSRNALFLCTLKTHHCRHRRLYWSNSLRVILISPSISVFSDWSLHMRFSNQNFRCISLSPILCTYPVHFIFTDLLIYKNY